MFIYTEFYFGVSRCFPFLVQWLEGNGLAHEWGGGEGERRETDRERAGGGGGGRERERGGGAWPVCRLLRLNNMSSNPIPF